MSAKPILYNWDNSPPVRTVKAVAKIIGVELDVRTLELLKGEQHQDWFLKLNPEHTVPTIDDNGVGVGDSHTICIYLVDKFAHNHQLYPTDLVKRAKINQRLFFDAGSLFVRLRDCSFSIFRQGATEVSADKLAAIFTAYDLFESTLNDAYLTGAEWNLADISCANTILANELYVPIDAAKYPKISAWLERVNKNIPHFTETNGIHIAEYKALIHQFLQKNREQAS